MNSSCVITIGTAAVTIGDPGLEPGISRTRSVRLSQLGQSPAVRAAEWVYTGLDAILAHKAHLEKGFQFATQYHTTYYIQCQGLYRRNRKNVMIMAILCA